MAMLCNFIFPQLEEEEDGVLQHDGATLHFSNSASAVLSFQGIRDRWPYLTAL
jgi:hypothetical protein